MENSTNNKGGCLMAAIAIALVIYGIYVLISLA